MQCELSAEARNMLASMAYDRWAKALEYAKEVRSLTWESAGKFCPKADWAQHKEHMLRLADMEIEKATALKNEICKYSPLVLGE